MQQTKYTTTPEEYRMMPMGEVHRRIKKRKEELGKRLIILTHHYQRRDVVSYGDFKGDSFKLCKYAAQNEAEFIAFCGVHFMAESSVVLARPEQKVFLPNPLAGCPMADMAQIEDVLAAWEELGEYFDLKKIIPISYMNSLADLKAFCGKNNGLICTSSNADKTFDWAFERGEQIFFFPDEHLGRNTANIKGIPKDQQFLWDYNAPPQKRDIEALKKAKIILWKGYCHVHAVFQTYHIEQLKKQDPAIKIVVHPECTEDVVAIADAVGSTSFIVQYVKEQPKGTKIAIGTDLNLVDRLVHENPDRKIIELAGQTCAMCVNMYRTTLNDLAFTLDNIESLPPMSVPDDVIEYARIALERMLAVSD